MTCLLLAPGPSVSPASSQCPGGRGTPNLLHLFRTGSRDASRSARCAIRNLLGLWPCRRGRTVLRWSAITGA
jgi:hypothetical protein